MTPNADCAYKAHFADGKLASQRPGEAAVPKPCAGTVGTHIVVEDMFYNAQVRIKAFKAPHEEYRLILDMSTSGVFFFFLKCAFHSPLSLHTA